MSLSGKVCVITGASSGIGYATAMLFAKEGAIVVAAARRLGNLEKLKAEIEAAGGVCTVVSTDVTKLDDIKALFAKTAEVHGRVDVLFNNAGWEGPTFPEDPCGFPSIPDEMLLQINQINMMAPVYCAKYAIAEMQKTGGGVVIGNASVAGAMPITFAGMVPVYHPTKVYMDAMTRSIAMTHAASGIKAYNLNPLAILTEMWQKIWDDIPAYAKPALEEQGIDSAEKYAFGFNQLFATDEKKENPLLYGEDCAKIVLTLANGTTKYEVGAGVVCAPGCTYHIKDLYKGIYGGWDMVNNPADDCNGRAGKYCMRNLVGDFLHELPAAAAAATAAPAAAANFSTVTTTVTSASASGATTTVTTTEATPQ